MRKQDFLLWCLVIFSFVLRFYRLDSLPVYLGGDSGVIGNNAKEIIRDKSNISFIGSGWYGIPNAYFYLIASEVWLFGNTFLGVRFYSALIGSLTVVFLFFLGKALFNSKIGLLGGFLLSINGTHLMFSRLVLPNIYDGLFSVVTLLFLVKAEKERRKIWFFIGGVVAGLGLYFYIAPRILLFWVIIFFLWKLFFQKYNIKKTIICFLLFIIGFVIISAPQLIYFFVHPDLFFSRINMHLDFKLSALQSFSLYNISELIYGFLIKFWQAIKIFFLPGEVSTAFYFITPLYLPPMSLFLLLGFYHLLFHFFKSKGYLLIYILLVVCIFGALLKDILIARYMIIFPLTALMVSLGILKTYRFLKNNKYFFYETVITGLLITGASIQLWFFLNFVSDTMNKEDYHAQISSLAGMYMKDNKLQNKDVYFLRTDNLYYEAIASARFFSGSFGRDLDKGFDYNIILEKEDVLFIIPKDRYEDLNKLQESISGGKLVDLVNPSGITVGYIYYK